MELPHGENFIILTSVFDWSTRVTDRRTDRRTGDSIERAKHMICYSLGRIHRSLPHKTWLESTGDRRAGWTRLPGWTSGAWDLDSFASHAPHVASTAVVLERSVFSILVTLRNVVTGDWDSFLWLSLTYGLTGRSPTSRVFSYIWFTCTAVYINLYTVWTRLFIRIIHHTDQKCNC